MFLEKNKRPSVRLCVTQGFTTKGRKVASKPPSSECTGGRFLLRYALWRTERLPISWLPQPR